MAYLPVRRARVRGFLLAATAAASLWSGAALAEQPADEAAWRQAFARIVEAREAGQLDEAERLARAAVAAAPASDPDTVAFAHAQLGLTLHARKRFEEAARELKTALDLTARAHGADSRDAMDLTVRLANAELAGGRFAVAEPLYLRAIEVSAQILGAGHSQTIELLNDVALIYAQQGQDAKALPLLERARAAAERAPGEGEKLLLRTLDNISGIHQRTDNFPEAERVARDVLARRTRIAGPDDEGTIFTANNLTTLYVNAGRLAEAEPLAVQSIERAERTLGLDHDTTLTAVMALAQVRAAQGRYAQAEPLLRRVLAVRERAAAQSAAWLEPAILLARGQMEQGRYREAEALYRRTLDTATKRLGLNDPLTHASANGLGLAVTMQGQYAEGEKLFRDSFARLEAAGRAASTPALHALSNLATSYQLQGRFAEAEPLLLRAIEAGERILGPDDPDVLLFLSNLAEIFVKQERIAEALPLAQRALAGAERRLGPDSPRTLLFANNVGAFLGQQGQIAQAEALLSRAFAGRERTFGFDNRDTLLTGTSVAALQYEQGKKQQAEALLRRILGSTERTLGVNHPETISARMLLANILLKEGRIADAEPLYARNLVDGRRFAPTDDSIIQSAAGLAVTRIAEAIATGRPRRDALTPARQAIAGIRARRTDRGGRFGAAQAARELLSRGDYFMLLADALWEEKADRATTGEAFLALQDAVAGTTDRAVMQMALRRYADDQDAGLGALVREREELEAGWAANANRQVELLTVPGVEEGERERVRAEAARIEARLDQVDAQLRQRFPEYLDLANPRAIPLENATSVLEADEALLLIVPGHRGTHLVAVTDAGLTWHVSTWDRDEINAAVRRLLWQLSRNVTPTPQEQAAWSREPEGAFDRGTAHRLYQELIAPMNRVLAGKRHVFVAAAGSLSSLPLGVLVTEAPQGSDSDPAALRTTKWLADAHALVQVPSVQSMLLLRRFTKEQAGGNRFLGFGDPALEGRAQTRGGPGSASRGAAPARPIFSGRLTRSGTPMADVTALRSMARLPGTAEELKNMREALAAPPNSIFLGPQATEKQFRSMDLSNVSILALATHGLVAGEVDGAAEPGLVFTPPAEPSEQDDGFLTASEVAALRLNADWVILSACNTASSDGSEGAPGLSGLARAFFYAGARAMLASHWPVRDDVAAKLTVRTVALRREQPNLSRAEAFQRAMREIRDDAAHDWAHPNAWAPFTLIGDAG